MSDFDQLIKEKVNSKEYSYSAKNWQSFTQKAGWKSGFALKHGLLIGAAVIVVAGGVYVAVRLSGDELQQSTTPSQDKPDTEIVMGQDSLLEADQLVAEEVKEMQTESTSTQTINHNGGATPKAEATSEGMPSSDTVSKKPKPTQKPVRRERITRIFEINTDTISSNEF
jgi:hypothetical protein